MKLKELNEIKHVVFRAGKVLFFCLIVLFITANIFSSQQIAPLYFQVAKDDRPAIVNFLSKITRLSDFEKLLRINKNIYGAYLEQEVFAESAKRRETITEYGLLLEKNPQSRDTLYNLYLLYQKEGNEIKAKEYLKRAKQIDPNL